MATTIARHNDADTPIRAVMLKRLCANVWHDTPAAAMAILEELKKTAKLWMSSNHQAEALSATHIEELRQTFGAVW